jgi:hypothetical protein
MGTQVMGPAQDCFTRPPVEGDDSKPPFCMLEDKDKQKVRQAPVDAPGAGQRRRI